MSPLHETAWSGTSCPAAVLRASPSRDGDTGTNTTEAALRFPRGCAAGRSEHDAGEREGRHPGPVAAGRPRSQCGTNQISAPATATPARVVSASRQPFIGTSLSSLERSDGEHLHRAAPRAARRLRLEHGVGRPGGAPDALEATQRLVDDRRQLACRARAAGRRRSRSRSRRAPRRRSQGGRRRARRGGRRRRAPSSASRRRRRRAT